MPELMSTSTPRFPNGEYEIEGVVGKGGMAIVYRARDMRHPRLVAIKVLRPEVAQTIGTARFLREIAVAAPFSHPHILPLIDSGQLTDEKGQSTPYYVMPLVDGETLHQKLVREGRLPIPLVLRITREILEALQYAHAQGVIHRDIKPANILLSGGHAVVADFGVSRPLPNVGDSGAGESAVTMTGDVIGTPSYMSPEQAMGHRVVDARSDLFSVGCVMYEMLVGDRPFDTPIPQYTATKKRHGIYASARDARPEVSIELDAVLAKALKPEPEDRYASAAAFLYALGQLETKDSSGWGVWQAPVPNWIRNVAIAALAVVGIVAATLKGGGAPVVAAAKAEPAVASNKARVAVLPMEAAGADSLISVVANGFQSDLIDELAQYPALTVISKNGVLQFRGNTATTDSIARVLNVGSVVTGSIKQVGEMVWVTVRLIDGVTGVIQRTATDSGSVHDLLAVRSSVVSSVTRSLRTVIGEVLKEREKNFAQNSEAWELHARALSLNESESGASGRLTAAERAKRYATIDSLLSRAAELDKAWSLPLATQAIIRNQQATSLEFAATGARTLNDASTWPPFRLRVQALEIANKAVDRAPRDAYALSVRGKVAFDLWRISRPTAPDSLRVTAERDLQAAVNLRPDLAAAWNTLSSLHYMSGSASLAAEDAKRALQADAFLRDAPATLSRRFFSSLAAGNVAEAKSLCATGQRIYPTAVQFWGCELSVLGWSANDRASVAKGWTILEQAESKDTAQMLISGWGTRRLMIAAAAARAGLADSARAIVRAVRASPLALIAPDNVDYGEAYVRALLNEPEQVFPLLEKFLLVNPALRGQVRESPWFKNLRTSPQFVALTNSK